MDKFQKAKTVERGWFLVVFALLALGGYCFGHFRGDLPDWQLVGLILTGYFFTYVIYRFAVKRALKSRGL
ncbi:hypothetical protein [Sphingomonas sp. GB1N7]|uniref:hypothetical protein n=1 Tax=Parasphingomonas caseinilytica TaxID=3096158 RepID=UPI002FC6B636